MKVHSRTIALCLACLALGLALAVLKREEAAHRAVSTGARADPAEQDLDLERRLEAVFEHAAPARLDRAWLSVRALGPGAPPASLALLAQTFRSADPKLEIPSWAGAEARIALAVSLLESGADAQDLGPLELVDEALPDAPDPVTLAFRIEYLGLLRRANDARATQRRVGWIVEAGIKWLERRADPASSEYARLAQAVFRSGGAVLDPDLERELRRLYGKLTLGSAKPGPSALVIAQRLEAMASFAWLRRTQDGRIDDQIAATLGAQRAALLEDPAWRGPADDLEAAASAVRALRLTRAVLDEGHPSRSPGGSK